MTMSGTMLPIRWNWPKLFSYGEVLCFISAWAVGLLIATQGERVAADRLAARAVATSDALGVQANLAR
jgi:hypothetical protein